MVYLDVVMIPQPVLNVIKKFKDVQSIETRLKESVHTLKRSLPQVQAIVHGVFERSHLNLTNQLPLQKKSKKIIHQTSLPTAFTYPDFGLHIQVGQECAEKITDQRRFVVGC